jgi:hypothetical protein
LMYFFSGTFPTSRLGWVFMVRSAENCDFGH